MARAQYFYAQYLERGWPKAGGLAPLVKSRLAGKPTLARDSRAVPGMIRDLARQESRLGLPPLERDLLEFVAAHYPAYIETFCGYRHGVQRADAVRYMPLRHSAGFTQINTRCQRSLECIVIDRQLRHLWHRRRLGIEER